VRRATAKLADSSRAAPLVALALAGLTMAFFVEWAAHAVAPATTEPGVVASTDGPYDAEGPKAEDFTIAAVLDSGQALDIADYNSEGLRDAVRVGTPVLVIRSHADGQVLGVRAPTGYVDTHDFAGSWFLRGFAVLGLACGLAVGLRAFPGAGLRRGPGALGEDTRGRGAVCGGAHRLRAALPRAGHSRTGSGRAPAGMSAGARGVLARRKIALDRRSLKLPPRSPERPERVSRARRGSRPRWRGTACARPRGGTPARWRCRRAGTPPRRRRRRAGSGPAR
jgi:hypothetical protein